MRGALAEVRGRDREVILEGGKRPGEERPIEDVNNVFAGERIRRMARARKGTWSSGSNPRSRDAARRETAWRTGESASARAEGVDAGDERGETSEGRVPMDDPA